MPLLDNALQHGIEDLERRLKADKPAAGQITVTFRDIGAEGIEMTVHDDGAGIDVDRIGRAAVASGLLTEATLGKRDEAKLMGMIFRPNFTTEGLPGNEGRGRGIPSVRQHRHAPRWQDCGGHETPPLYALYDPPASPDRGHGSRYCVARTPRLDKPARWRVQCP